MGPPALSSPAMLLPWMAVILSAAPMKVALLPLNPGEGVNEATAEAVTQAVAAELRRFPDLAILTQAELAAVLSVERQKSLVGCQSEQCLTELGGALDVQQIVIGSVAKLGQSWILHLQRVDARKATTTASADRRKKGGSIDDVLDELPQMTRELFPGMTPNAPGSEPSAKAQVSATPSAPVPPGGLDEPLEGVDRAKLKVVTDGKGFFLAFVPFGGMEAPLLGGDGKRFWAQRVRGGGSEGDKRFSLNFWEPRARVPADARFDFKDGAYLLTCGKQELKLTEVPAVKAKKLLADAKLNKPRWRRRAHALARDDEGTTFYVDQAREPDTNTDFRLFTGTQGKLVARVPDVLAADDEGVILGADGGKLRLSFQKREAEWIRGGQKTKLTWLEVEDNVQRIYSALGAYSEPLGTLCDGRI